VVCRTASLAGVLLLAPACEGFSGPTGAGGNQAGSGAGGGGSSASGRGGEGGRTVDVTPCGPPAEPFAKACPTVCNGGCDNRTCVVLCAADDACAAPIQCPAGMPCQITCTGQNSCRNQIGCDDFFGCAITCNGAGACSDATITCGSVSGCDVTCLNGACEGASLECGDGRCGATCFNNAMMSVACGDSCQCTDGNCS
jgi:hypothetical protein